jgi:hypothetical protein
MVRSEGRDDDAPGQEPAAKFGRRGSARRGPTDRFLSEHRRNDDASAGNRPVMPRDEYETFGVARFGSASAGRHFFVFAASTRKPPSKTQKAYPPMNGRLTNKSTIATIANTSAAINPKSIFIPSFLPSFFDASPACMPQSQVEHLIGGTALWTTIESKSRRVCCKDSSHAAQVAVRPWV